MPLIKFSGCIEFLFAIFSVSNSYMTLTAMVKKCAALNNFSTIPRHLPFLKYLSQTSISYVTVERVRAAIGAFPR